MEYNRYGRVGEAPTRGRGGRSGQSYFIEDPLRETRVLPHLQLLPSTRATVPLPYGYFPRDNIGRLGIDVFGTHLRDGGATLSPYGFREPIGISARVPEPYREPRYRSHDLARRQSTGLGQRQIISREMDGTPSTTARKKRPVRRITPSRQRDHKLTPPRDSDTTERSSSSSPTDDDSNSLPTVSEPKQKLQVQPEKEVSHQELNKKTNKELQPKFTETSETKEEASENHKDSNNLERPGWCSLCDIDCVTKEVLHKVHAFGKKHQSWIKKLEEASRDRKKWLESVAWCSLCEVRCETMEVLHTEHILTEKHQMMLGNQPKPQRRQDDPVQDIDSSIGKRKKQEEEENMSSPKRQKLLVSATDCKICNKVFNSQVVLESHLAGKRHAFQLKKIGNSAALLDVNNGQCKKPVGLDVQVSDNSKLEISSKNNGKEEEGSMSSPKPQNSFVLSTDCKICNKVFTSQIVLESHLAGKKHASQLKKIENSAALLDVNNGQSKKLVGLDVLKTEKDDRKEISEPTEIDNEDDQESMVRSEKHASRESSKSNEVHGKKDDTLGSRS